MKKSVGAAVLTFALVAAGANRLAAQEHAGELGTRLIQDASVQAALKAAQANEPQLLDDQARICEVPAPPFKEDKRAVLFRQLLEEAGLTGARIDRVGNVIAERPGLAPRPHLVFSASAHRR
jgi:hypothetical protein